MTTPFPFQVGATLLSSELNAITELVVNDKTASHTLTAADAGDRVIMNSASATTITVDTSIFTAGQVIHVTNKGAGVCTIVAGSATVSTTGTLALSQFASGVLYCISAGVFLFEGYDKAATASGLTVVQAETAFSAVASFTADGVFTSTFTNYKLILRYETSGNNPLSLQFRAASVDTATGYNRQNFAADDTTISGSRSVAQTSSRIAEGTTGAFISLATLEISGPQLAAATNFLSYNVRNVGFANPIQHEFYANQSASTQFDGIKVLVATGTMTGTFTIYGYSK